MTYRSTLPGVDNMMEILRTATAEAGIGLNLEPVDAATYSGKVTNGHTFDISYAVWGTIDDVDTTLYTVYGIGQSLNYMEYNNEESDALLKEMRTVADYQERIKLLDQWQQLWVEELPCIMTHVPVQTFAADTTRFAGFDTTFGYYGYLGCAQLCQVYQL